MAGIKWTGIDEFEVGIDGITNLEAVKEIIKYNGAALQQKAMRNSPVQTGFLRRSIVLELEDNGMTARCQAKANYAPYVEWGTRFMESKLYMRRAFDAQAQQFIRDMQKLAK